jgi:hypothetical protein
MIRRKQELSTLYHSHQSEWIEIIYYKKSKYIQSNPWLVITKICRIKHESRL